MPTEKQIKAPFIATHKELIRQRYKYGLISQAEHDLLHALNWDDMETELIAEGYRNPQKPTRDVLKELDDLRLKITELEKK